MQRWTHLGDVPPGFGPSVVTIGNFDGVHRGHRVVLGRVVERARALGALAVAITFDPHPLAVLYPERAPQPLSTVDHKLELLAAEGLDGVLVMPFTHELAGQSPRQFVEETMVAGLGARAVVVGGDMRFGKGNAGNVDTLRELGEELGFEVDVIADEGNAGPDDDRRWSSTWVRELVAAGDVETAADVLGRPHRVTGAVVHGDHRGRELGYPTANLAPDAVGAVPADGVYAGWLTRPDSRRAPAGGDLRRHQPDLRRHPAARRGVRPRPRRPGPLRRDRRRSSSPTGCGRRCASPASTTSCARWPRTSPAAGSSWT